MSLIRLKATVNSYDWGKPASESLVARFGEHGSDLLLDKTKRYSELWVGTHPNGCASLHDSGESLKAWLENNPSALSSTNDEDKEEGLCFLFKILSIGKALSIQAHPNQSRARELFETRPDLYKDPNHKPEMACALTDFEALLGFENIATIVSHVQETPELKALLLATERGSLAWQQLVSAAESKNLLERKEALKQFFYCVLSSDAKLVAMQVDALVTRVLHAQTRSPCKKRQEVTNKNMDRLNTLALRLHEEFPHDVGIFCAYIMCYRKLQAGDAVFLTSNEPHAYLSGECVEVMANSDNVIRAALTPKFKDLDELERMLTYNEPHSVDNNVGWHPCQVLRGERRDANTLIFPPPDPEVWEFQLERTKVELRAPCKLVAGTYASVLFVTEGEGRVGALQAMPGATFFLAAGARVILSGNLVVYRVTKRGSVKV